MFRAVLLPIIRSLFTVHAAGVYVIPVLTSFQAGPGWNRVPSWPCSKAVYKSVWHIPSLSAQWINSWWRAEELPETCRVSCRSKFGKLVHLVGFIIKKLAINRRVPTRPSISSPPDEWLYTLKNHPFSWISWLCNLFVVKGRHDGKAVSLLSFNDVSSGTVQHIATTFAFRHAVKIVWCKWWRYIMTEYTFICSHKTGNRAKNFYVPA
jgi:hypothetical protein